MMKYAAFLFSLGVLIFLFLVSCQAGEETAVASTQTPVTTPTALAAVPTATLTPTATTEATPLPTATTTQTPVVTLTPLPTLLPDEAANKVIALLQDNQNPDCLLPCWWGVVLGQTKWRDIEPFLRSFAVDITEVPKGAAVVTIPLPESVAAHGHSYVSFGWDESEIIRGIMIDSMNIPGYDPKTMMTLYGAPDEVWLKTFPDVLPGDVLPFQLNIIYQDLGISLHYYKDASQARGTVTACFEPGVVEVKHPDLYPTGPQIRLWDGPPRTIDKVTNDPDETYYPLEEKIDLTPQTFYEKFTNPNESPGIETPSELWND